MAQDNQFGFYRDVQLNNGALVVTGITGGGGGTSGTSGTSGAAGTNGTSGTSGGGSATPTSGSHFNYTMTPSRSYNLATGGVYEQNGLEANSIWAFPFTPGRNITISALTFDAFNGNADGEIKLLAYTNNNTTGVPGSLIIESPAISVADGGIKQYNVSYTFSAGTTYWLAIAANSTGNVQGRGITQYNAFPFGVPNAGGSGTIYTLARSYTLTFPTIPSTFTLNDLQGARIPEVRFIVA
jgi:hypothetical protein